MGGTGVIGDLAQRRGWCPGMLRPMATGDGLLVRLHPRHGELKAAQLAVIASGAKRHGNGLIDISSRGNLQIRGVTSETHSALAESLMACGITDGARPKGPFRLTLASPLAGLDPSDRIDARALAEAIETATQSLAGLPAKTLVVVDGGGRMPMTACAGDLRLVALDRNRLSLSLATREGFEDAGTLRLEHAPGLVRAVLTAFADAVHADPDLRRIRDLSPSARRGLLDGLSLDPPAPLPARLAPLRAGMVETGEAFALLISLPYGRCDANTLTSIADGSARFGPGIVRLTPWRGIAIPGLALNDAMHLCDSARALGLIVRDDDPRLALDACPGSPACAQSSASTHPDAGRIAQAAHHLLAQGLRVHVSGCSKGCAHPAVADLTLVGEAGAYDVILNGTTQSESSGRWTIDSLCARLKTMDDLESLMSSFARPGA